MKPAMRSSFLVLLLFATVAHAQLYKWVGPDGKVTYSDTPPPPIAKQVEQKTVASASAATSGLPYELAQAANANPVTLYTTAECQSCDQGRTSLNARGIPFSEKTVSTNDDLAQLRQAGGSGSLPLLRVGRNKHEGFEAGAWNKLLTAAGYPETSRLPSTYRQRAAEPAAPVAAKATPDKSQNQPARPTADARRSGELPPASGNAPPGFRF